MMPHLNRYLDRLYATIHSRDEIDLQEFEVFDRSDAEGRISELYARLKFWNGSNLQFAEALRVQSFAIVKVRYSYHYQSGDDTLVDNVSCSGVK